MAILRPYEARILLARRDSFVKKLKEGSYTRKGDITAAQNWLQKHEKHFEEWENLAQFFIEYPNKKIVRKLKFKKKSI